MNIASGLAGPTLQEAFEHIQSDEGLTATRRRDLRSALRRLSAILDRPLTALPAHLPLLRPLVNDINPVLHDLSAKSWANLRSNILAAVRHAGLVEKRPTGLAPAWQAFSDALPAKELSWGLSRFTRWCSDQGLLPDQVDDAALESFRFWLDANALVKDPWGYCQTIARAWNRATTALPELGLQTLSPPHRPSNRVRRLSLSAFPESFRADIEAYLAQRADPDLFDPEAPPKPAKPGTIRLLREQLRLAANALVERGYDPRDITCLRELVEPEAFKTILRQLLAEHDGAGSFWCENLRKTLLTFAKHWCRLPEVELKVLRALSRRVPKPEPGLTPKNRACLRQFDDPRNLARLLQLPERLFAEALRETAPTLKAARKAQIAITIEILLNCPIRAGNLRCLQLGKHILRPNGPKGPVFLCLDPEEVKNEQRIDFELPKGLAKMLATYVSRFLPCFGGDGMHLFLTGTGAPKSYGALAAQVVRVVKERTGLVITLHQFRHLGAKLHLEEVPGGYESLRQLLGHRNAQTTIRSYAGVQTRQAARLHDQVLQDRRAALQHLGRGKPRRRATPS